MKKYSKLLAIILVVCMLLPGIAQAAPQNGVKANQIIEKDKSREELEDELEEAREELEDKLEREREELEDKLEREREELEDKIEEAIEEAEEAIEDLEDIKVTIKNKDKLVVMLARAKQLVAEAKKLDKNSKFDLYIIDRIEKAIAKLEKPVNPNDKELAEAISAAEKSIAALKKIKNIKLSDKEAIEDARELVNIVKQMNPKAVVKGEKDLAKFEDRIKKLEKEEEKDEAKKLQKAIKAARKDLEEFESRLNNKKKVLKLVQDDKSREKLSKSHTDVFNKIQQISDKKVKDEFLARLDKAHDKLIAASSVKSLQNAVKGLNPENLNQAKLKLSNAKTTVRFLENGDIKDALNALVKLEEDKIKAFEAMEQEKKDKEAAANFDKLMTRFKESGEITPEYIENVRLAREAYNALNEKAKSLTYPSNIGKLERVEARIAEYEEIKKDKEAAARVDSLIGQFPEKGEINEEYIAKVRAARAAYDALSERAKGFMIPSNIAKLARVEARIAEYEEEIRKDKEAAARVDSLIGQFPEMGEINEEYIAKVRAARAAYDALNERAKGFVNPGNIAKLERVEVRIADYEENMKNAKVTLDLDGGKVKDGAVTEFVVKKGEKFKLPARIILGLEKEGYTFTGWLNTTTGEFIKQFGPEVTVDENVTYKAVWEASKGTVLLDVYSRNPAVKIPSAIVLIDKDGKRYEFKSKSYGAKTRSWETIEKLPNGEYTLEFEGLKNNTSITLKGYPLNPVINRGDAKVTPNTGSEKDQYKLVVKFLDNSPVVSSKIDMTIVESEEDILIAEAQEAVDLAEYKLIRAKTLEEADAVINDAYAKVKKLPFESSIRTELNNRLAALAENNVVIRLLEGTDYVVLLAQNRSASQAQTTLNNLQKEVDKIITTVFKTKYQNFIDEQQKNVDAMVIATNTVEKARKNQSMEDVNSAQALIDGLIPGNVKLILSASNAVTKAEISRLEADVNAARALIAALAYKNDRTPLNKRLDAIVVEEPALTIAIRQAEEAIAALPLLGDIKIEDKGAVLNAKSLVEAVKALNPEALVKGEELIDPLLDRIAQLEKELNKPYVKSVTHNVDSNGNYYRLSEWSNLPEVNERGYFYKLNFKFKDGTEYLSVGNPVRITTIHRYIKKQAEEIKNFDVIIFQANGQFGPFEELTRINDVVFEGPNEEAREIFKARVAVGKAERAKNENKVEDAKKFLEEARPIVAALPEGQDKDDLLARIQIVQEWIDQQETPEEASVIVTFNRRFSGANTMGKVSIEIKGIPEAVKFNVVYKTVFGDKTTAKVGIYESIDNVSYDSKGSETIVINIYDSADKLLETFNVKPIVVEPK